jgi:uncharacterized protein YfaS (alpha-2-macroglobulin family)
MQMYGWIFFVVVLSGMASLEFQLIDDAKLGDWVIEVTVEGEMTPTSFVVKEYGMYQFLVICK